MSTAWWISVTALIAVAAFSAGFIVALEYAIWTRARGETIDFTRRKVGA